MAKIQVPSVGRVVHYTYQGECFPAIVVKVWNPGSPISSLALHVFSFERGDYVEPAVSFGDVHGWGTWHWPEYVPPIDDGEPEVLTVVAQ